MMKRYVVIAGPWHPALLQAMLRDKRAESRKLRLYAVRLAGGRPVVGRRFETGDTPAVGHTVIATYPVSMFAALLVRAYLVSWANDWAEQQRATDRDYAGHVVRVAVAARSELACQQVLDGVGR